MAQAKKVQRDAGTSVVAVAANDAVPVFQSLAVAEFDGEPRVRDLDLAERLGFDRPRKIRELIERNMAEIEAMGVCPAVGQTHGPKGGRPTKEFYLNEEQALLVAVLSNAPQAKAVRAMLVRTFVAYRRGQLEAPAGMTDAESHKVVGGIVKSIVHKEITEAIPHVVDRLVEQRISSDPRIAALDYVSVTDLLDKEWKVPQKGRRSIQRRVLNRLKDHCLADGIRGSKAALQRHLDFPAPRSQRVHPRELRRDHQGPHRQGDWSVGDPVPAAGRRLKHLEPLAHRGRLYGAVPTRA